MTEKQINGILFTAVLYKSKEIVTYLIEKYPRISINYTALFGLACYKGYEPIVGYFLEVVPNITNRAYPNGSPLFKAASRGHKDICRLLIGSGVIIDDSFQHQSSKRWKNELKTIPCHDLLIKYRGKNINEIALELGDKLIKLSLKRERNKVIKELIPLVSEYHIVGNIIETKINESKNHD